MLVGSYMCVGRKRCHTDKTSFFGNLKRIFTLWVYFPICLKVSWDDTISNSQSTKTFPGTHDILIPKPSSCKKIVTCFPFNYRPLLSKIFHGKYNKLLFHSSVVGLKAPVLKCWRFYWLFVGFSWFSFMTINYCNRSNLRFLAGPYAHSGGRNWRTILRVVKTQQIIPNHFRLLLLSVSQPVYAPFCRNIGVKR